MGSQVICSPGKSPAPWNDVTFRSTRYPRSVKRFTPRNGLAVPTLSTWHDALHMPRCLDDHLCMIDTALEIADAVATSNGTDEAKAFDDACKEMGLRVTPTTRQNAINYLKA